MDYIEIIELLKGQADEKNIAGMSRFGISGQNMLGISVKFLRDLAKKIEKDNHLAIQLWDSGIHEAKILATIIAKPKSFSLNQLKSWVNDLDSWDICDQFCSNLVAKTEHALELAKIWSLSKEEFVKRAGFVTMAYLATKKSNRYDDELIQFLPIIKENALDDRNFVKKAVNWALRQIGKRSDPLNKEAVKVAEEILKIDSKTAKWIADDALKELKTRFNQ